MFDPREKIALFIDGANLYAASKALGFDIDYRKLLKAFKARARVLRAYYYTTVLGDSDQQYSPLHPLLDWLHYNGFKVVSKVAKEFTENCGRKKIKASMDVELAVDAFEQSEGIDHLVIFSGDGDFATLVEALQRKSKKVTIVSTVLSNPSMVSDQLRRQADHFIDLAYLKNEIQRESYERDLEEKNDPE
ncbi:NYN domain-containing protein [Candidatus Liberibacter solanacearum]|uniref:NYN domain-containing protein n=1 Tax=Candidatus Liberibacter solanacearum TaxID=556287 RepID=A0A3R7NPZ7_9HYPH|nr:NYN domain-containing protein [Candidatus Liberibacter solanacearum]RPD37304.1 NYN domain-containing protein [Candidatus Liberibacter solanacearum]